jgi:molybdopterin synthase catalytic subunit
LNERTGVYPKTKLSFPKVFQNFTSRLGPRTGAVTFFLGVARKESADGKRNVKALVMESYARHANKALQRICAETKREFLLNDIVIVHALGKFLPGETVVLVAVSSARRDNSFKALRKAVERYKKEPAIFKKEVYEDNSSAWIS